METAVEWVRAGEQCPACGAAWNGTSRCEGCGLNRGDMDMLMESAIAAAARARVCADRGRFSEALPHIAAAREQGLDHPVLDRLEAICRAVSGEWSDLRVADLPDAWAEAIEAGEAAARYAEARSAAARADLTAAREAVEAAVAAAPWLLPARKLQILVLAAEGHCAEAEELRRELLDEAPEETDLLRYRFTAPETPAPASEPTVNVPARVIARRQPARHRGILPWVAAGFVFAGVFIGYSLAHRQQPRPLPPPGS